MIDGPVFKPAGESALLVIFGAQLDGSINQRVHALARSLMVNPLPGLGEALPGYATLLVQYDPLYWTFSALETVLQERLYQVQTEEECISCLIEIPVIYGGTRGVDLDFVCRHTGFSTDEVIRRHSQVEYQVYMMGFTPGFAYLGGMDAALTTPRLNTPRICVPAGTVGIAGAQTGVYPIDSPGGWQMIGYTPLRLFDPAKSQPFLLAPGDRVRFVPRRDGAE